MFYLDSLLLFFSQFTSSGISSSIILQLSWNLQAVTAITFSLTSLSFLPSVSSLNALANHYNHCFNFFLPLPLVHSLGWTLTKVRPTYAPECDVFKFRIPVLRWAMILLSSHTGFSPSIHSPTLFDEYFISFLWSNLPLTTSYLMEKRKVWKKTSAFSHPSVSSSCILASLQLWQVNHPLLWQRPVFPPGVPDPMPICLFKDIALIILSPFSASSSSPCPSAPPLSSLHTELFPSAHKHISVALKAFPWYYLPLHLPLQFPNLLYIETLWKCCLYLF